MIVILFFGLNALRSLIDVNEGKFDMTHTKVMKWSPLNDTPSDITQRSISGQTIMHPCKYTTIIHLPIKNSEEEWNTGFLLCFSALLITCDIEWEKKKILFVRFYSGISYFGSSTRFVSTQAYLQIHCYAPTRFIGFILCCGRVDLIPVCVCVDRSVWTSISRYRIQNK